MHNEPVTARHGATPRRRWIPILVSVAVVVCVAGAVVLPIWLPRELQRRQAEAQLAHIRLALEAYAANPLFGMTLPV